jgi:hypothetical protein
MPSSIVSCAACAKLRVDWLRAARALRSRQANRVQRAFHDIFWPVRRARLSFGLCVRLLAASIAAQLVGPTLKPALAQAGAGSEIIADPELQTAGGDENGETIADPELQSSGAEVIADPELGGLSVDDSAMRAEPNGEVRLELHTRLGVDTEWQDPREDVFEGQQIVLLEARVRRSEDVRFALGVRARYWYARFAHDVPDSGAAHYELDAVPTAGYVDITAADGLHLRAGYQSVRLGRFDVLNPSDILSVYDLRSGPTTLPEASEIAQPALTIDWDIGSWLGLRAIVVPFFEPHLVHLTDGDYALAPVSQSEIDSQFTPPRDPTAPPPTIEEQMRTVATQHFVRRALSRSGKVRLNDATLSAFAPEPTLTRPQAALRLLAHGPSGEIGLTAGIAREHLATPSFSRAYLAYLDAQSQMMGGASRAEIDALLASHPIEMHYDPYAIASLDAATAVGPFQVGVELAYLFHRTLLAASTVPVAVVTPPAGADDMVDPNAAADAVDFIDYSDFAHAGARIEYAPDNDFLFTIETMVQRAMQPPQGSNRQYLFLADGRWVLAAAGFVSGQPWDIGLTLELGAGVLNGPSYMLAPRAQQRVAEDLWVEAGAYFVGGTHPPRANPMLGSIGALYDSVDQVFVGLRWVP